MTITQLPPLESGMTTRLSVEMLLDIFDEPIVIQRNFLHLTGSLNSAMLLSTIVSLSQDQLEISDGWLRLTQTEWQRTTSLSRFELEAARAVLRKQSLIDERRKGMPARNEVRLRVDRLAQALNDQAQQRYVSKPIGSQRRAD